ncbi:YdcF family protein [Falsiroseomonas bella]|uniref:YdcF family protein n=1 Tax=Falsiroseomonas bella TaxID=2184016 RepID=A0A317FFK6_9PROT|nr:YdcF family protein [Falsiroseomonas bella]PWS37854.1 YdcF family protein [Falsiroseomonas bella]
MTWLRRLLPPLVLLGLAALGFLWFLHEVSAAPAEPARRTGGIVVLTGGAGRVEAGLALLEAGAAPRLLVSGAAPRLTLAELARANQRAPAALAGRVDLGHAAATTTGNAAETAAWARARGIDSLRVVTADYHMPRAMLELRRAMPNVTLLPHPVPIPGLPFARRAWLLTLEYAKLGAAFTGLAALLPAREAASR